MSWPRPGLTMMRRDQWPSGAVIWAHYTLHQSHKLPFIRENNPVITDRPHPADSSNVSSEPGDQSRHKWSNLQPWKHGADNGPETGATESRPQGEKAFPTRSTGFLKHFDFFWFYVDWTKRDQLIFLYLHFKRRQKDFLFPFECVGLLTDGEVNSKSKLSMRICWA